MAVQTRTLAYEHEGEALEGYMAWDEAFSLPRPGVLLCHTNRGRGSFECEYAKDLARSGYSAFALDLYGKGVYYEDREEAAVKMREFTENRPFLQSRLLSGLRSACLQKKEIHEKHLAAIGFCFGGLCALDLARMNLGLAGVLSFHGFLGKPPNIKSKSIQTRILVLHGWEDPMVSLQDLLKFTEEMRLAEADWQIHAYGRAMHAFTNPSANDPDFGVMYNPTVAKRAKQSMLNFLEELFGDSFVNGR